MTSNKSKQSQASAKKKVVDKGKSGANKAKDGKKLLELGLLLDCTSSMGSWIERAKKTL